MKTSSQSLYVDMKKKPGVATAENFITMIEYPFEKQHHKTQETRNNCFLPKKCSTTLRQAKAGKHECQNITVRI